MILLSKLFAYLLATIMMLPSLMTGNHLIKINPSPSPAINSRVDFDPSMISPTPEQVTKFYTHQPEVKLTTPLINSDPLVLCNVHQNCGGGTTLLRQSECNNTTCCQIGDNWIFYKDKNKCTQDQASNNQNNSYNYYPNNQNTPVYIPSYNNNNSNYIYPTSIPYPTFDHQQAQQQCIDNENKSYNDLLYEYQRSWGHPPTTDLMQQQHGINLANCSKL